MGKKLIGAWDCEYCNKKAIPGNIRECPGCGRPKGENVKFYLPNTKNYVSSEEENNISKNPDWLCSFCNSLNSDNDNVCISCGHSRELDDLNYFENLEKQSKNSNSQNLDEDLYNDEEIKKSKENLNYNIISTNSDETNSIFSKIIGLKDKINLPLIGIIISIISVLLFVCIPRTEIRTVESTSWEYTIKIEEEKTVRESDWDVPNGGRLIETRQEIHHYKQVFDHYETKTRQVSEQVLVGYKEVVVGYKDMGNGFFEEITQQQPEYETRYKTETYEEPVYRSEPVYQTKYYYDIERWFYKRSEISSGFDKNPYWKEVKLAKKERIAEKIEKYFYTTKNKKGKEKKVEVKYDNWKTAEKGMKVKVRTWFFFFDQIIYEK